MKDLKELLTETKRICEAATPGPWLESFHQDGHTLEPDTKRWFQSIVETIEDPTFIATADYISENDVENFKFIAHARTQLPRLLAALELAVSKYGVLTEELYSWNDNAVACNELDRVLKAELARVLRGES